MTENLRNAIATVVDETEDAINVAASNISRLESDKTDIDSQLAQAEHERSELEGTLDTLDSFKLSLDRCPYCLSRHQKQSFLSEEEDSYGGKYLECPACSAEFDAE